MKRFCAPLLQVDLPKDSGADSGGVLAEPCASNARAVAICINGEAASIPPGGAYVDTHGIVYGIKFRVYDINTGEFATGRDSLDSLPP